MNVKKEFKNKNKSQTVRIPAGLLKEIDGLKEFPGQPRWWTIQKVVNEYINNRADEMPKKRRMV